MADTDSETSGVDPADETMKILQTMIEAMEAISPAEFAAMVPPERRAEVLITFRGAKERIDVLLAMLNRRVSDLNQLVSDLNQRASEPGTEQGTR